MANPYKKTVIACYLGYVTQAIVNNFAPLLFLLFHRQYGISLERIGLLITVNFATQLTVDTLSARFVDRIGYRKCVCAAHLFCAAGLIGLTFLPSVLPSPFLGLCAAMVLYAVGGGLIEVLVSPILEACPLGEKSAAMSLLHSFYCWGSVLVVLLTTAFFHFFGTSAWRVPAVLWALLPVCNFFLFLRVPINTLTEKGGGMSIRTLLSSGLFWYLFALMLCAGASELAMSQWASAFAESGLKVSKAVGDLLGPCLFAVLMGSSRVVHAKIGSRVPMPLYLGASACACIAGYLMASLSGSAYLSLLGCGLCGFSVGAMWPGTFSLAARACPRGGTALFALLAFAGDVGCAFGPFLVGLATSRFQDDLKQGILVAAVFPAIMLLFLLFGRKKERPDGPDPSLPA